MANGYNGNYTEGNVFCSLVDSDGPASITYHLRFPEEVVVADRIQAQGLIDTIVYSISEDTDGSIWVGTEKGISVFDGENWTSF